MTTPQLTPLEQFAKASELYSSKVQCEQCFCRIFNAYAGPDQANHNCLGCTLNDVSDEIDRFLKLAARQDSGLTEVQSMSISLLLLNGLWERMQEVIKILSVPDCYIARHFEAFKRVRRWANFFKHPKEFGWQIHHPEYRIGVESSAIPDGFLPVNEEFIKKHFSAEAKSGLSNALRNFERKVIVEVPSPIEIVDGVCKSAKVFVDLVTENPVYVEVLKDRATIVNYFNAEPEGAV